MFFSSSIEIEVYGLINQRKSHKAKRANDIETRFINLANPVIAHVLSEIFNQCVSTDINHDAMKVA